jgi:hypothetical protein
MSWNSERGASSLWVAALVFVIFMAVSVYLIAQEQPPAFLDKLRTQVLLLFRG